MSLSRHTILLIEDDPNDVALLDRILSGLNLAKPLLVLSTGEKAIAHLENAAQEQSALPTLIFLDLKLPGLSGFELLTWIRQQPYLRNVQVVVMTGSRKSLDVYRAYELGANSYLVKPVKPEDLASLAESLNLPWLALAERSASGAGSVANGDVRPAAV